MQFHRGCHGVGHVHSHAGLQAAHQPQPHAAAAAAAAAAQQSQLLKQRGIVATGGVDAPLKAQHSVTCCAAAWRRRRRHGEHRHEALHRQPQPLARERRRQRGRDMRGNGEQHHATSRAAVHVPVV